MKLSLGPLQYCWDSKTVWEFYDSAADWPVDIVYLGEVVCAKRRALRLDDWLSIAEYLVSSGKEVVFSTLALVEAKSDLASIGRIIENGSYMVEANDLAAIGMLEGIKPFVVGPHINTYNSESLRIFSEAGARRWVMPAELDKSTLAAMQTDRPMNIETEIFVFGRISLAFSARCFTARAHNINKDDCGICCEDYKDGLILSTQDSQEFLTINGKQIQSAQTYNLIKVVAELKELNVDILRISPQGEGTVDVVNVFHNVINGQLDVEQATGLLAPHIPTGSCDGYWVGAPGMDARLGNVNPA